jgi:protein required for attachment to host cells
MSNLLVLVADTRSAKLMSRRTNGDLDELWQLYSADDRVRALGQSPDTRELASTPVTPASSTFASEAFAGEIATRLNESCEPADVMSILLIAPPGFGDVLRRGLSPALWQRVQHSVPRDKTELSDDGLRKLVDETVATYG